MFSIGRDICCDTLLLLQKLEELYLGNTLSAKDPKDRALEQLLDRRTSDIVFQRAVGTIPGDVLAMNDPAFCKHRVKFVGLRVGKGQAGQGVTYCFKRSARGV